LPYNINCLTQASVAFALDNYSIFEAQAQKIRSERTRLYDALNDIDGIEVFPSQANFILLRTRPGKAVEIHQALIKEKILIKNLHKPEKSAKENLLADCLRVTVGSPEQNDLFLAALQKVIR
ncbi:MAG: aminotransferase class I/II-fold pyridoxal phosphate-dependent enzyme, partial [Gammaproteobacteria bacterium]|nr:aminotransferase class I/II-fold pyridoxal phosphate-dependent enzyme [Gammaproteobacteria bacterium]